MRKERDGNGSERERRVGGGGEKRMDEGISVLMCIWGELSVLFVRKG